MNIQLRGKPFFRGLQAVLVCPTPIRVLCVFGSEKSMLDQFFECADQVLRLGQGFRILATERQIVTPIGSVLMFQSIVTPKDVVRVQGLELHDLGIEDGHPFREEIWTKLACRVRL